MTKRNTYREQLQDIDVNLAKDITKRSDETHRFSIFPEGYRADPAHETLIEYRCTGDAAVVYVWSPKAMEYAKSMGFVTTFGYIFSEINVNIL